MKIIAGPCSFESEEQTLAVVKFLTGLGITDIRGGVRKYRSVASAYQGTNEVYDWIAKAKQYYEFTYYAEVFDEHDIRFSSGIIDVYQVGSRNMYNTSLLKMLNTMGKPVLLKRHYCASLKELVMHAEYLKDCDVTLCLRGKQSLFPQEQRFAHDFADIDILRSLTSLPICYDASHSSCWSYRVSNAVKGALCYEPDSIMIETHPTPADALSDPDQQLNFKQFEELLKEINYGY